jgi:tetratricopeptide (TPR) repeat protein
MIRVLLQIGEEKLEAGQLAEAERRFRRALAHSSGNNQAVYRKLRLETICCLQRTYEQQKNWSALETTLMEKISWLTKESTTETKTILVATLDLAQALQHKKDYKQALLYCRRALKGFRKLGPIAATSYEGSVRLMIDIHCAEGNDLEEEAWNSILQRTKSPVGSSTSVERMRKPLSRESSSEQRYMEMKQQHDPIMEETTPPNVENPTRGEADESEKLKAAFEGRAFVSELDETLQTDCRSKSTVMQQAIDTSDESLTAKCHLPEAFITLPSAKSENTNAEVPDPHPSLGVDDKNDTTGMDSWKPEDDKPSSENGVLHGQAESFIKADTTISGDFIHEGDVIAEATLSPQMPPPPLITPDTRAMADNDACGGVVWEGHVDELEFRPFSPLPPRGPEPSADPSKAPSSTQTQIRMQSEATSSVDKSEDSASIYSWRGDTESDSQTVVTTGSLDLTGSRSM